MIRIHLFFYFVGMALLSVFQPAEGAAMVKDSAGWRASKSRAPRIEAGGRGTVLLGFAGGLVIVCLWLWALATVAAWAVS